MDSIQTRGNPVTLNRYLAILAAVLVVFASLFSFEADRSYAASPGTGETYGWLGYIGSFQLSNGESAYCVEVAVPEPWGAQLPSEVVSTLPGFTSNRVVGASIGYSGDPLVSPDLNDPEKIRQLNYIVTKWGDTNNQMEGAAVALAVFGVRGDTVGYTHRLLEAIGDNGGAAALQRSREMITEARSNATAPLQGKPVKAPVVSVDNEGQGSLEFFEGTRTLVLTNAVFTDTDSALRSIAEGESGVVEINGVTPTGWDSSYDITAQGTWESGYEGWRAELKLHAPQDPAEQRIVTGTGRTKDRAVHAEFTATATVTNYWWPQVTTQVEQRILELGDTFVDEVSVVAHPDGGFWSAAEDGTHMPLLLQGIMYGPLEKDPAHDPQKDAPGGTSIAAEVSLQIKDGPGTYRAVAPGVAIKSGFYTWVWRIDWEDQQNEVTKPSRTGISALQSDQFPIQDGFGIASETHLVKQRLNLVTRLSEGDVGLGWSLTDDVAVVAEQFGGWLKDGSGEVIPVNVRGTVYHSVEIPTQNSEVPQTAREVAHTMMSVNGPEIMLSERIPLPLDTAGYVTMRWCILEEDQDETYRGYTRDWCDDYGVPAETARVTAPKVTTLAQSQATVGETIIDRAYVEGLIPNESTLSFTAYLFPKLGDPVTLNDWEIDGDRVWTEEMLAQLGDDELCLAQPVAVTDRVSVKHSGEIVSPGVTTKSSGTIHWVERLYAVDPTTGEDTLVHEGECGIVNETTEVTPKPTPQADVESTPEAKRKPKLAHTGQAQQFGVATALAGLTSISIGTITMVRRRMRHN